MVEPIAVPPAMSEGLFRVVAEGAIDLICLMDLTGRVVYGNPAVARLLGRTPAHDVEYIHADDLEAFRAWWHGLVSGGRERNTSRWRDHAGEWHSIESWGVQVSHEGRPHVLTTGRDVTEQMRMVQTLRESEAKLAEAERVAQVGYWENDLIADRITWSEETYRILGLRPGEHAPTLAVLHALTHPDDRALQIEASARTQRGGAQYDLVYRVVRPDGEIRTIHSVGYLVRDDAGRPLRAFGVVQDITVRKRAEEERALFRSLIDHTNDALEVIDPATGRFLDVNERACLAHGYTRDEYLQLCVSDIDPRVAERPWQETREETRRLGSRIFESQHRRKDGSVFPVEINLTVVQRDREYFLAVVRDISERKRAAEELRRVEEQLRQAQKMEALGRLAGGVAHDFNNLLTVLNGNLEFVADILGSDPSMGVVLDDMREAGERGAGLTHQLLALCRKQVLQPRAVDVDALLRKLRHLLGRVIGEDVEVRLLDNPGTGRVKVDAGQLEQAIINLAINARDAMPAGGTISIEARNDDRDSVLVLVSDSGHGMDEATRARIFEPFFTTKGVGRGTGLGLAMVLAFVEQSGGQIDVQSEVGRGTTFTIRLPRTDEVPIEAQPLSRESGSGTETVLLVEDEDAVRSFSRRALQAKGYTVLDARDGTDAIAVSRRYPAPINVLVTDVVMPRMGGRDAAEVLSLERPSMRILFMSGYTEQPVLPAASSGAFLQKPFRAGDLTRKVRDLLDDTQPTVSP
jgi:PAS domain S-box-containing protein